MSVFTNRDARIDALRQVAIFADLPKKDLLLLDRHVTPTRVSAGTELAREGFAPLQFVLLVDGTASVRRGGRLIARLGPGSAIGELSLLDGGAQSATVTADEDCAVLAVAANEFRAMLDESPGFAKNLLKSLAQRLRATDELVTAG
jgi:CRP-like cAMP-binding protein